MILKTTKQKEYELIDSGNGKKLERYGSYIISRPDPEALWKRNLDDKEWEKLDLEFIRNGTKNKWIIKNGILNNWNIKFGGLDFNIKPTSFKHLGLFPEQLPNWEWMSELIRCGKRPCLKGAQGEASGSNSISVLNLFAYTGGATLACAKAGAEVCHVDGSKSAVDWARLNAELSGLKDAPIRWLIEDVTLFLKREIKRGRKYDAIIMDPPAFGHGPKDELWKIEEHFLTLMDLCKQVLSTDPLFILINGYTAGYSSIVYQNNLIDLMKDYKGFVAGGELVIEDSTNKKLLPCGIFARWSKE
ncbi:MAG: SAM dependent methyltransferase [Candidatus Nomurabacteria bacterium GW2011_GWF2_35_66]|uniref:SAM dependent methyltransferase n=1 Tax=Candidatus Nomurabacteria bacterium GW2011_GWE1_35_16 TaxID=1618761 RepID=A0A0G0B8G9_9BACT|nr:MAG: SAM dependent methyltransferase [Candidatus Nomurabacteria bacterium GW2011_GWF1_34_20]KKP63335.1 MAG: SAM dependent methyltransferase [Candidatus Nomurabacteria bacterium GW2011_GWE2_34_25]KKP65678.1 MAG: SAM dependent methyltransferase [Candidatus Nomurabacteria bacterium GW2011_GWE1_35_16]KKP83572.1 MAG: SAM dependent methyltransferase [Candidatus Nomurabacteria bacterium GW2011_GWF2_35_66]HAE36833.1 SAM-dependent methyltransferase [Candidatus Nomurabacteria bacterium]